MKAAYIFMIMAAALYLEGCVTRAQQRADTLSAADQQMRTCTTRAFATLPTATFAHRFASNPLRPTLEQLSDSSIPDDTQSAALYRFHDMIAACEISFVSVYSMPAPNVAAVIIEASRKTDAAILLLAQKKMSWGEYNGAMQSISSGFGLSDREERRRFNASLRQENAVEIAQRQRALQAVCQGLQSFGNSMQESANAYQRAADSIASQAPPQPPDPSPVGTLDGLYIRQPQPHGCVGQVPVNGAGLNPCPSP